MNSHTSIASSFEEISASSVRDFITLMKPGVMMLVVFTAFTALCLAPVHIHPYLAFLTVLCVALGSGAGGAINMWYDRDIDGRMLRTSTRPIPSGRVAPGDALALGLFMGVGSVALLGLAVNLLAAGLLAFAIVFYAVFYTMYLKRRTPQNIVIGGAAGAFPPIIGWAAATGTIDLQPLWMFALVFLWTPPHFWALALYRAGDYARVGVPMLPVVAGQKVTKQYIFAYSLLLIAASMVPLLMGWQGVIYAVCATLLAAQWIWLAWRVLREETQESAKRLFGFSILYLFLLFSAMIIDHWIPFSIGG